MFSGALVRAALILYHPRCIDLVPYLSVNEESQSPLYPNKAKSSVHGETGKEGGREVLTSFTNVAGLEKGSSDMQKQNKNHSLQFGMMKNGTHTKNFLFYNAQIILLFSEKRRLLNLQLSITHFH